MKREDGIRRHLRLRRDVADAETSEIGRHAVLLDQDYRAWNFSGRGFVLKKIGQALKSRRRRRGRIGLRTGEGATPGDRHDQSRENPDHHRRTAILRRFIASGECKRVVGTDRIRSGAGRTKNNGVKSMTTAAYSTLAPRRRSASICSLV